MRYLKPHQRIDLDEPKCPIAIPIVLLLTAIGYLANSGLLH